MASQPLKIGFVGLGIMGAPMALHLIEAGHQLFVFTRGKTPGTIANSSARPCINARDVAERADIIFTMVPDTPDVEAVLFGESGVAGARFSDDAMIAAHLLDPTRGFADVEDAARQLLGIDLPDDPAARADAAFRLIEKGRAELGKRDHESRLVCCG